MWQKLAPRKKFEAEKQQKQDKSRKMFLSTSEKSPLPENCCGHEERQQVKKQRLYRWLRLVFSQNAYDLVLSSIVFSKFNILKFTIFLSTIFGMLKRLKYQILNKNILLQILSLNL